MIFRANVVLFTTCCMLVAGVPVSAQTQLTAAKVAGTYRSTQPCATCDSMQSLLELTPDTDSTGNFALVEQYFDGTKKVIGAAIRGEWMVAVMAINGKKKEVITLNYDREEEQVHFYLLPGGNLTRTDDAWQPMVCDFDCSYKKEPVHQSTVK